MLIKLAMANFPTLRYAICPKRFIKTVIFQYFHKYKIRGGVFMSKIEDYYTFNEYIKNNNLTPSEEDYIEMIYRLTLENNKVQVKDISAKLNIKPPSVTKMVKKLDNKNLINYKKYDNIELTSMGFRVGANLLNRHNTIKKFLEIIGIKESIH